MRDAEGLARVAYEAIAFYVPLPANGTCAAEARIPSVAALADGAADATTGSRPTSPRTSGWRARDSCPKASPCARRGRTPITRPTSSACSSRRRSAPPRRSCAEVKARGIAAWLDEQLALNVTRYTQYPFFVPPDDPTQCVDDTTPPVTPEKYCHTYKIAPWPVGWEFFRQSKTAPDQLRLRMAHVWHQIFVVSDGPGTYAYAEFHQRCATTRSATSRSCSRSTRCRRSSASTRTGSSTSPSTTACGRTRISRAS